MNMENVRKINGVVCTFVAPEAVLMYGRKKQIYNKSNKLVSNHILTGKFVSEPIKDNTCQK